MCAIRCLFAVEGRARTSEVKEEDNMINLAACWSTSRCELATFSCMKFYEIRNLNVTVQWQCCADSATLLCLSPSSSSIFKTRSSDLTRAPRGNMFTELVSKVCLPG